MRSAVFWDFMQRRMVIPYRRCGTVQTTSSILKGQEDGTDRLSRNVGTE